jgi:predicted phosphodiesterase
MRIAVFSDIHGNMDAFEKVLEDLDRSGADAAYCLGDNIGYGAEPERVIQALRHRSIPSVMGNHELAAVDPGFLGWFNAAARQSLVKTFTLLSSGSLAFIQSLPRHISADGCRFVHGFPPDSPTQYLFQVEHRRQREVLDALPEQMFFIGHTHLLDVTVCLGEAMTAVDFRIGSNPLDPRLKYLVNIGAVGQPRDGDPRAKYVIWDSDARRLDIRCVSYDAHAAAAKIRAAGLPESHARRLVGPG